MAEPSRKNAVLLWAGIAGTLVLIVWLVWPRAEKRDQKIADVQPGQRVASPRDEMRARPPVREHEQPSRVPPPPNQEPALTQPAAVPSRPAQPVRTSALRAALEREVPDDTAQQAEERIRAIFAKEDEAGQVFRHALCTRSVCRIDLRWSPELSDAYNAGLIKVIEEFSREMSFEPEQPLDGARMPIPMNVFVARPGHTVESLLAEEAG